MEDLASADYERERIARKGRGTGILRGILFAFFKEKNSRNNVSLLGRSTPPLLFLPRNPQAKNRNGDAKHDSRKRVFVPAG